MSMAASFTTRPLTVSGGRDNWVKTYPAIWPLNRGFLKKLLRLEIPTIKSPLNSFNRRASICHGINLNQFIQMFVLFWLGEYTWLLTSSVIEIKNVLTKGSINLLWTATRCLAFICLMQNTSLQDQRTDISMKEASKSCFYCVREKREVEYGKSSWVLLSLESIRGRWRLSAWRKWHSAC